MDAVLHLEEQIIRTTRDPTSMHIRIQAYTFTYDFQSHFTVQNNPDCAPEKYSGFSSWFCSVMASLKDQDTPVVMHLEIPGETCVTQNNGEPCRASFQLVPSNFTVIKRKRTWRDAGETLDVGPRSKKRK